MCLSLILSYTPRLISVLPFPLVPDICVVANTTWESGRHLYRCRTRGHQGTPPPLASTLVTSPTPHTADQSSILLRTLPYVHLYTTGFNHEKNILHFGHGWKFSVLDVLFSLRGDDRLRRVCSLVLGLRFAVKKKETEVNSHSLSLASHSTSSVVKAVVTS